MSHLQPSQPAANAGDAGARRASIVATVENAGYASVADLAETFSVTEMTIRRDVRLLADQGLVRRVHGGASRVDPPLGTPFEERQAARAAQKTAVATVAASLLEPGTVVAFDSGTTVAEVPAHLSDGLALTVVTHSVPVMAALAHRGDLTVIGLGGQLNPGTHSFAGPTTRAAVAELTLDTLLLSASGVSAEGLHCATPHDADIKQALMARAAVVILLVDSGKVGVAAAVRVAPLTAVDILVADVDLTDDQERLIRTAAPGLRLLRAAL